MLQKLIPPAEPMEVEPESEGDATGDAARPSMELAVAAVLLARLEKDGIKDVPPGREAQMYPAMSHALAILLCGDPTRA